MSSRVFRSSGVIRETACLRCSHDQQLDHIIGETHAQTFPTSMSSNFFEAHLSLFAAL